jgi:hypothetical protein
VFQTLKPLAILIAVFYGYGSKSMESYRPAKLDLPLKNFNRDINSLVNVGVRSYEAISYELDSSNDPLEIAGRSLRAVGREVRTSQYSVWR